MTSRRYIAICSLVTLISLFLVAGDAVAGQKSKSKDRDLNPGGLKHAVEIFLDANESDGEIGDWVSVKNPVAVSKVDGRGGVSPVPEPGAALLYSAGLLLLAGKMAPRRRRD
jgi:hypothetical protein